MAVLPTARETRKNISKTLGHTEEMHMLVRNLAKKKIVINSKIFIVTYTNYNMLVELFMDAQLAKLAFMWDASQHFTTKML